MPPETETEVLTRLTAIETKLDSIIGKDTDHEARIRVLEQRRTISPGQLWGAICTLIALLVGLTILSKFVLEVIIR